jgi:hypothetical protein
MRSFRRRERSAADDGPAGRRRDVRNEAFADAMVDTVQNIQTAFVGEGRHFIQEDQPEMIGRTLSDWRRRIGGN